MSICNNFEGALMKAIRSLEQHVDSLMSYDFTGLSREELVKQLHVVDDRRIWVIAEALRRGVSYDHIYEITKIDRWFIDNGLTNLTLFRHYLMHYLAERPDIIKEMYIVARTLKPSPSGIPLEIYCFTTSTLWKDYENTQSAIFEYITAVAGQFSLRLYQYPAGHDFWRLSQEHAARTGLPPSAEG